MCVCVVFVVFMEGGGLLIGMSNIQIYVINHVHQDSWLARQPVSKNYDIGHDAQTLQPHFFRPFMLKGSDTKDEIYDPVAGSL